MATVYGLPFEGSIAKLDGAFQAQTKPVEYEFEVAESAGTVQTLEGPVSYEQGDCVMKDGRGKRWAMRRESFVQKYVSVPDSPNTARKKLNTVIARQMSDDFDVQLPWGKHDVIRGSKGDFLVEYKPGDCAPVAAEIFMETYQRVLDDEPAS